MTRLRDMLLGLRAQIPESLLAGRGWERLVERVGELPAAAAAACGFELRLGDPDPVADFSVAVTAGPVARHYVACGERAAPASAEAWLGRLLRDRGGDRIGTDDWIDALLVGYDFAEVPVGQHAAPVVFLKPATAHRLRPGGFPRDLLARTLARAAGRRGARDERSALARALEALPPGADVVFAAAAPGTTPRSVKLVVAQVPAPEAVPFLGRLGWIGSTPTVLRLLSELHDVSSRFMISVDVTADGALPRLGLEMYPEYSGGDDPDALLTTWLRTTRSDWRGLVDRLVDLRLCLPAKARGLLAWPRNHNLYGRRGIFRLYMGVNHVKITVSGERLKAKAYAGLKCLPMEPVAGRPLLFGENPLRPAAGTSR